MQKTPQEIERKFIEELKNNTNKNLSDWLLDINNSGIHKRSEIIKWLKEKHSFEYINASLLASIYLNGGKLVYEIQAK